MFAKWVQTLSQIPELQNPDSSLSQTLCQKTAAQTPQYSSTLKWQIAWKGSYESQKLNSKMFLLRLFNYEMTENTLKTENP